MTTLGGDAKKNRHFQGRKIRSHGTICSHGSNFLASPLGAMWMKLAIVQERKTRSHGIFSLEIASRCVLFWQKGKVVMHG